MSGHHPVHMGLQKHSVGDSYPWHVVGIANGENIHYEIHNLLNGCKLGVRVHEGWEVWKGDCESATNVLDNINNIALSPYGLWGFRIIEDGQPVVNEAVWPYESRVFESGGVTNYFVQAQNSDAVLQAAFEQAGEPWTFTPEGRIIKTFDARVPKAVPVEDLPSVLQPTIMAAFLELLLRGSVVVRVSIQP